MQFIFFVAVFIGICGSAYADSAFSGLNDAIDRMNKRKHEMRMAGCYEYPQIIQEQNLTIEQQNTSIEYLRNQIQELESKLEECECYD